MLHGTAVEASCVLAERLRNAEVLQIGHVKPTSAGLNLHQRPARRPGLHSRLRTARLILEEVDFIKRSEVGIFSGPLKSRKERLGGNTHQL